MSSDRDDPDVHLMELAGGLDLRGSGVGLLTGVDVAKVVKIEVEDAVTWATVGLGNAVLAADQAPAVELYSAGTISVVALVP